MPERRRGGLEVTGNKYQSSAGKRGGGRGSSFGGREVFLRTSVAMPMDRAFASMSEIESYSFERSAYGAVVEVKLGNVEDLSETVRKVEAAVAKLPADGRLWVRISDTRDVLCRMCTTECTSI